MALVFVTPAMSLPCGRCGAKQYGDWLFDVFHYGHRVVAEIIGYTGTETNITIPSEIGQLMVEEVSLSSSCPSELCLKRNLYVETVVIPYGITHIGELSFQSLRGVVIPNSVNHISGSNSLAFREGTFSNTSLSTVIIPNRVWHIGSGAFANTPLLTSVVFKSPTPPRSLGNIFYNSALQTIYVPLGAYNAYRAIPQFSEFDIVEVTCNFCYNCDFCKSKDFRRSQISVNINTALQILRYLVDLPNEATIRMHDFNDNGEIDIDDALQVLRYLVGLPSEIGVWRNRV